MKAVRTVAGLKLWQVAATAFPPGRSPWYRYCDDRLIGKYSLAILAVNFQMRVNELPIDNPWAVESWPAGFLLVMPDRETANRFPDGTDVDTMLSRLGISASPSEVIGRVVAGNAAADTRIPEWVESWNKYMRQQALRYGERIARNLPADEIVMQYRDG